MHLRTLEMFCSVAEFQSFSRAAAEHDVTQSAVSQSVQHLEESLGARLLDRTRRPLALTPAGEVYLAGVLKLLRGYQRLEQDVRALDGRLAGRLSIAAIYSIGSTYMPSAREEFRRRHPGVEVRFEYGSADAVSRMVESGEVDFGLVSYPKNTRKLRFVSWLEEPMRVISTASHRLAGGGEIGLPDLDGEEFVGFDSSLKIRRVVDAFLARHGVSVDVTMEFDNIDSMIRAVQANEGLTILPESTVRKECADGSLRVIACRAMQLTRPLGVVIRRAGGLSRAADEFTSLLLGRSIGSSPAPGRRGRPAPRSDPPATQDPELKSTDGTDRLGGPAGDSGGAGPSARASVVA